MSERESSDAAWAAMRERAHKAEAEVVHWRERYNTLCSAAAKLVLELSRVRLLLLSRGGVRDAMDELSKELRPNERPPP